MTGEAASEKRAERKRGVAILCLRAGGVLHLLGASAILLFRWWQRVTDEAFGANQTIFGIRDVYAYAALLVGAASLVFARQLVLNVLGPHLCYGVSLAWIVHVLTWQDMYELFWYFRGSRSWITLAVSLTGLAVAVLYAVPIFVRGPKRGWGMRGPTSA